MIEVITHNDSKFLVIDGVYQSCSGLTEDNDLLLSYMKVFNDYALNTNHVLMLGGGAYAWVRYYLKYFTGNIDVVEINPKLTELAKEQFFLKENKRLNIIHMDGNDYIAQDNIGPYDLIINDMFIKDIPIYVNMNNIYKILTENGIYLQNIIGQPKIYYVPEHSDNSILIWRK